MKYKCLIAENNVLERDMLEMLLRKIDQAEIVAVCADGMEALKVLNDQEIDIVFSDVDMPDLSGIGLLKSLKKAPVFVFISAFSQYAVDGFDLDVADFIVKPVMQERLIRAFNKAKDRLESRKETLPPVLIESASDDYIFIRTSEGLQKVMLKDINYIESLANFSRVHTTDGKHFMVLINLKNLESQLPAGSFIRVHKQYIINWPHVTVFNHSSITVAGKLELPVGETYRQALLDKMSVHRILERKPGK